MLLCTDMSNRGYVGNFITRTQWSVLVITVAHFPIRATLTVYFACRKNDQEALTARSQEIYLKFNMTYPADVIRF
jgi:hypothetical protein